MFNMRIIIILGAVILLIVGVGALALSNMLRRTPGAVFDSGGVEIFYTDEGSGEAVILLHGFAVNSDLNWRLPGVSTALAEKYRIIAMDLRGHGLSEKVRGPDAYGVEMANDVVRLMDHLNLEQAHLAGYSLGGVISIKLAALNPDRFLTINPLGAGWESEEDGVFLKAAPHIAASLEKGEGVPPLSKFLGGARKKPGVVHTYWVKTVSRFLNDGPALADMVRQLSGLTVTREELSQISLSMCAIVGENDSMRAGVEAMRGVAPNLTVHVIAGADHISALKNQAFLPALYDCLSR